MSYDELIEEAYQEQVKAILRNSFQSLMLGDTVVEDRMLNGLRKAKEARTYLKALLLDE